MAEESGRLATESIPPSVLLDRVLEQQGRAISEGFARIDARLQAFTEAIATMQRNFIILVGVVLVLLMARDFTKVGLEMGLFKLHTESTPRVAAPVSTEPPSDSPAPATAAPETALVQ